MEDEARDMPCVISLDLSTEIPNPQFKGQTSGSSGEHSFLYGSSRVQALAQLPGIVAEIFHCFLQSLQENSG
jgi:hypothetical protein